MTRTSLLPLAALVAAALFCAAPTAGAAEIRWGGDEFVGPASLREWLTARGLDYETWARNHPRAAAQLAGDEEPRPAGTEPIGEVPRSLPVGSESAAPPKPASRAPSAVLLGLFAGVAACLLLLALLPSVRPLRVGLLAALERRQLELASVGVAIAVAIAAAYFL